MRIFPPVLGIVAVVCLSLISRYRNGFPIISSLASLTLTLSLFLILITVTDRLNRSNIKIAKLLDKVKRFSFKKKSSQKINKEAQLIESRQGQETGGQESEPLQKDGLLEIKRENVFQARHDAGASLQERWFAVFYIVAFLGIAIWRAVALLKSTPWQYTVQYSASIVDAVLLLVLPCVCVSYLKIRKDGLYLTDKITRDILIFFSYTSFFYAALIAAASVLKVNFQIVLPFVYCVLTAYLIASLAVNIALSMLKGNVLSFDYTLFPKLFLKSDETQEVNWKVSLKSLYTIRYTLSILPALSLALFFILLLSTTVFVVQPHQQAAVYRFGKLESSSIKNEGLHFKFPWPVDKAEIFDVHRAVSMQIGYESSRTANFLWTQKHDGGEYMLLLGNGNEMAAVNIKIMYVISDLFLYIKTCTTPEAVLNGATYNALMTRTVNTTLDSFLSVDRNSLSASVLDELSLFCKSENLGFSVVQVIVESIHPPVDIADVYQNVVSASVQKTTLITRAQGYASAKVIEAQRQSKTAVEQAKALQYSKTSDAQKEADVFLAAAQAYGISGGSFELAKQLEVYEKLIKSNKIYVFSPGMQNNISKFVIGKKSAFLGEDNE